MRFDSKDIVGALSAELENTLILSRYSKSRDTRLSLSQIVERQVDQQCGDRETDRDTNGNLDHLRGHVHRDACRGGKIFN